MGRIVELTVAGTALEVTRLAGAMAMSRPFELEVEAFVLDSPPEIADLLGQRYELIITDAHGTPLPVHGLVVSVARHPDVLREGTRFDLGLGSPAAHLGVGRDSRVFQEMTVVDIVTDVFERGGLEDVEWRTRATYPERPYTAQYRESDWSFVTRLLAEEGIWWFFDFVDGATKLVLGDDSTGAEDLADGAELPYSDAGGLSAAGAAVRHLSRRASLVHDAVRIRDYDFHKPRLLLDEKAGSGDAEVYDFPGRFAVPADGQRLATVRLQGLQRGREVTSGMSSTVRLAVGRALEIGGHPLDAMNGRYLVERVNYRCSEPLRSAAGDTGGLKMAFDAIPLATQWRAPRGAVTRDPAGPETAVVVGASGEEIHSDDSGRIRAQFYWDRLGKRDDKASTWMRVGQFPLGGSMILPRIGWDVLVQHHEGDIDAPYIAAHLYDGQFPVPYALPANKTRTSWQTATTPGGGSSNEVRFEDSAGGEEIFINSTKDTNVTIGDCKNEKVGVDLTETIGSNLSIDVGTTRKAGIVADQEVTIGASESLTVSGSRAVTVTGSESTTVGASRSVTVIKGSTIEAVGGRSLTVGGSMMGVSALAVSRMVLGSYNMTVGGAWIRVAATGVANATAGACAETVGGAKVHAGASGCSTSVQGACAETVGGAYAITAAGNVGETSTGAMAITVGGAFMANAPTVEIEADSEISIRCGGTSLTIKSGSVEIKSPTIAAPGASVVKKGSKVEHN